MCAIESNTTTVRRLFADCGSLIFVLSRLWRVLSGLVFLAVALDNPVS